jgi:dTDP-4-dehydrorhamnose reductase
MLRILLTGATGQVGFELARSLQGLGSVIAPGRGQMDLADPAALREVIRAVKPDLIINPAAYTAVDQAERDSVLALRINAEAPAIMAEEAARLGAGMIQFSTDYVFDGTKDGAYTESDTPCPINVYGSSKLAGEHAVSSAGIPHLILRTSWVYGLHGKNFLLTVRRLAQQQDTLRIVDDQFGAPTWSRTIAETTARIVAQRNGRLDAGECGLFHLTAQGATSWHGFAQAILAHPSNPHQPTLLPIPASDYPTPALRPANSRLSCARLMALAGPLPQWDAALAQCLA